MRSSMSIKMQRVHLAAIVCFRYASLLANILRDVNQRRLKFPVLGTNLKIHSPQNDLAKICMEVSGSCINR